jgi:hypothetical protein
MELMKENKADRAESGGTNARLKKGFDPLERDWRRRSSKFPGSVERTEDFWLAPPLICPIYWGLALPGSRLPKAKAPASTGGTRDVHGWAGRFDELDAVRRKRTLAPLQYHL